MVVVDHRGIEGAAMVEQAAVAISLGVPGQASLFAAFLRGNPVPLAQVGAPLGEHDPGDTDGGHHERDPDRRGGHAAIIR